MFVHFLHTMSTALSSLQATKSPIRNQSMKVKDTHLLAFPHDTISIQGDVAHVDHVSVQHIVAAPPHICNDAQTPDQPLVVLVVQAWTDAKASKNVSVDLRIL